MNPFELRSHLLSVSKDLLTQQYEAGIKALEMTKKVTELNNKDMPQFPTADEIVEQAIKFNQFISGAIESELVNGVKKLHRITAVF
jgi:hypothetical protein